MPSVESANTMVSRLEMNCLELVFWHTLSVRVRSFLVIELIQWFRGSWVATVLERYDIPPRS